MNLRRVFALQLEILGTSMGTAGRAGRRCWRSVSSGGVRPVIDSVYGFSAVADAFARLHSGEVFGKVVLDHTR